MEILARKANLSKIPRVKFSRNGEIAHAGLKGNVTISLKWLRKWERSEIEENQVDAVLAHEIGHLMDFKRHVRSVFFKSTFIVMTYFILLPCALFLLDYGFSSSNGPLPWVSFLMVFVGWLIFLPYVTRSSCSKAQFEADSYACQLIGAENMANSFAIRIEQGYTQLSRDLIFVKTFKIIIQVFLYPSLVERLEHINFEVANVKVAIKQRSDN